MKRKYESPLMVVEMFSPNVAISNCYNTSVTFDCMAGGNRDTENVVVDMGNLSCEISAGFTELTTAYNPSGNNHSSHNNNLSWGKIENSGRWDKTVTATGNASGLLYICAAKQSDNQADDYSTNGWHPNSSGQLEHSTNEGYSHSCTHVMVAPVYGDPSGISTGS